MPRHVTEDIPMTDNLYLIRSNFDQMFIEYISVENTPDAITHAAFTNAFSEQPTVTLMAHKGPGSTTAVETSIKDVTKTGFRIKSDQPSPTVERFTAMAIGRRIVT